MTPEERLHVLLAGVRALREVDRQLRALLLPAQQVNLPLLRELRAIVNLLESLERAAEFTDHDPDSIDFRDSILSMEPDADDLRLLLNSPRLRPADSPYREEGATDEKSALVALYNMLLRYAAGEFASPNRLRMDRPDA